MKSMKYLKVFLHFLHVLHGEYTSHRIFEIIFYFSRLFTCLADNKYFMN